VPKYRPYQKHHEVIEVSSAGPSTFFKALRVSKDQTMQGYNFWVLLTRCANDCKCKCQELTFWGLGGSTHGIGRVFILTNYCYRSSKIYPPKDGRSEDNDMSTKSILVWYYLCIDD
jgi:hypothetical protein